MKNPFSRFWIALTREQKLSVGILSVCGIVTIVLGIVQLRRTIIYPFTAPVEKLVEIKNMFGPTEAELEAEAKRTDSDGDGLSDWDEENVYRTSSYLADTDSDGEADNLEIAKGTDPNCPVGKVCAFIQPEDGGTDSKSGSAVQSGSEGGMNIPGSVLSLKPERDPAAIRTFLQAQGMSDAELSNYTDAMLLEAYDQSSSSFEDSSNTVTDTVTETDTDTDTDTVTD